MNGKERFSRGYRGGVPTPIAARSPASAHQRSIYTLIGTAKLNDVDPQAWLADVLERIAQHPIRRLHELLPWHWANKARSLAA